MPEKIALIGRSIRENERRLPLHPSHLPDLPERIRRRLWVDAGYGRDFGMTDQRLAVLGFEVADREELLATADVVVIPKPMERDLQTIKPGATIWGWLHFVLYGHLADICIERRHTVVTWEAMYETTCTASRKRHIFSGNNELAGYAGTLHALGLRGLDGCYGPPLRCAVIGHGYAGRASLRALLNRGFQNVCAYSQRPPERVADRIDGVRYLQIARDQVSGTSVVGQDYRPFWQELKEFDVIVNCGGQDPEDPLMYLLEKDVGSFDHDCLIVDISCDPGMGFPFTRTTTFDAPTYRVGRCMVCAVDHSPGYLWDAATWQISTEVLHFIDTVSQGAAAIRQAPVLAAAIEIDGGTIRNQKIISYQSRSHHYPHARFQAAK